MTEKRFTMKGSTILENGEEITAWDCYDLLNQLYEENQDLKAFNQDLSEELSVCANARTSKDNRIERLEEKIERERKLYVEQHLRWSKEAEMKIKELSDENEELKQELKVYRKVASCSNCKYHNYDWDIDDGYGGEEYEVCDKGNDVTDGICEEWEEL